MLMPAIFGESLFDNFFDDFTRPARSVMRYSTPTMSAMKTDVRETDSGYELDIELPGYQKEDVHAELKDGYMTISAEMNVSNDTKDEDGTFIRRERCYGSCSRSFYVGSEVEQNDIKAKFENGILKISVPKKLEKPKVEESQYISIEG